MIELKDKDIVTRGTHRCAWCPEKIEPKSPAHVRAYIWEGDFHAEHWHPECWAAFMRADWTDEGFDLQAQKRGSEEDAYA